MRGVEEAVQKADGDRPDAGIPKGSDRLAHSGLVVNIEIKRLIDQLREQGALPDQNSMPKQAPSAAIFQRHKSGAIAIVPPGAQDRLADTDEVRDFYSEVVDKNTELLSLGVNMLGQRLYEKARVFRSRLPEHAAQAVERLVWSSGNTLRSILAAHDLVAADRDPHPEKLDSGAAERLRDVVGTFNQLAIADPALRLRDANRPGPQEHHRSLDEINIVAGIAIEAAGNRFITTIEAGDELSQQIAGAGEAEAGSARQTWCAAGTRYISKFFRSDDGCRLSRNTERSGDGTRRGGIRVKGIL